MEIERYKMIYTKKVNKRLEKEINLYLKEKTIEKIKSDNIRVLGHDFVKNNKNKAKLIINNKKYSLKEFIDSKDFFNDKIKINMILIKELSNISHLFKDCFKLQELSIYDNTINIDDEIEKIEQHNDYDIYNIDGSKDSSYYDNFYKNLKKDNTYQSNSEIINLEEIETNKDKSTISYIRDKIIIYQYNYYYDMTKIFYNCLSLLSLPDIAKWNTNNVRDMSYIFANCWSIPSLPDISRWNTNNVNNMKRMFDSCMSLKSLPDISEWNTNNVSDMSEMFAICLSLSSLPDISNLNTNNVIDISRIFSSYPSSLPLPDISKWNTRKVINMSQIFYNCHSLSSLPDISKWNTENVTDMSYMFDNCKSLLSLPDISNWNIINVKNMSCMFHYCSSLLSLPDISKWNTNNVTNLYFLI